MGFPSDVDEQWKGSGAPPCVIPGMPFRLPPLDMDLGRMDRGWEHVSPKELAECLLSGSQPAPIVIDVRGGDAGGGHIATARNVKYSEFQERCDGIVDDLLKAGHAQGQWLVLHCMYSRERAPRCATRVLEALQARGEGEATRRLQVSVLSGGFHRWINTFKDRPEWDRLVQGYREEVWIDTAGMNRMVHVNDCPFHARAQVSIREHLEQYRTEQDANELYWDLQRMDIAQT